MARRIRLADGRIGADRRRGSVLAAHSGEQLEERFEASGQDIPALLKDHAELGEVARTMAFVFLAVVLAWVVYAYRHRRHSRSTTVNRKTRHVATALAVAAVITGGVATATIIAAGHNGARSVWETTIP